MTPGADRPLPPDGGDLPRQRPALALAFAAPIGLLGGLRSVAGALAGGALVGVIPNPALKLDLGVIFNDSAWRIFRYSRRH